MRSRRELLEASGYASRPEQFDDLPYVLDGGLRLVAAVVAEKHARRLRTFVNEQCVR